MISSRPTYGEPSFGEAQCAAVENAFADWLSEQGAEDIVPITGAASFRAFVRLRRGHDPLVAMHAPAPQEDSSRFVDFARIFAEAGVPVPRILAHDEERGFVLMSDVGIAHLQTVYGTPAEDAALKLAIDQLINLQQIPAETFPPYTKERLTDELGIFEEWFVRGLLGKTPPDDWSSTRDALVERVAAQPTVTVHRDYHCQNLLFTAPDQLGVVDFQDALAGPQMYDLGSLLRDCYHRFSEDQIAIYLRYYTERTEVPSDAAALMDLTALQRQLKAVGIFARLSQRDGKDTHLGYIDDVLDHAVVLTGRHGLPGFLAPWLANLRARQP